MSDKGINPVAGDGGMRFSWGGIEAEADRQQAREMGRECQEVEWVCSDRDVWYRNPFYTGEPGPHPEDDNRETGSDDDEPEAFDEIPF